jgi:hypothetical protein
MIFDRVLEVATVWGISIGGVAVVVWAGVRLLSECKSRREITRHLEQVIMDLETGQVFQ